MVIVMGHKFWIVGAKLGVTHNLDHSRRNNKSHQGHELRIQKNTEHDHAGCKMTEGMENAMSKIET